MKLENRDTTAVALLASLVEVEQCARNVFSTALSRSDSPGLRTLKLNLAGLHSDHLRNLRSEIYALGGPVRVGISGKPGGSGWPQLQVALVSSRPESVASACARAEEKVALAYEQALGNPGLDQALHPLVGGQLQAVRRACEGIGRLSDH